MWCLVLLFPSLPHNKILDLCEVKALADYNFIVTQMMEFVLTHYQTTNIRLFQNERLCRRQFKI